MVVVSKISALIILLIQAKSVVLDETCNVDNAKFDDNIMEWQVGDLKLTLDANNRLSLKLLLEQEVVFESKLGKSLPSSLSSPQSSSSNELRLTWGPSEISLDLRSLENKCHQIKWTLDTSKFKAVEDCFPIDEATKWFMGAEEYQQHFPLNNEESWRHSTPLLPGDMIQRPREYFGGVLEPMLISSKGVLIWFRNETIGNFIRLDNKTNEICLEARDEHPFSVGDELELNYHLCAKQDAKEARLFFGQELMAINNRNYEMSVGSNEEVNLPSFDMFAYPIFSTWALFKTEVNESVVLNFAKNIVEEGFNISQLEIDDDWERCYGSLTFDSTKFPDPLAMVERLKNELEVKAVTLWVHPFVNLEQCFDIWAQLKNKGYLVKDVNTVPNGEALPGLMWWWQGDVASLIDFTNEEAALHFINRLKELQISAGIDSFKFDGGETNWLPLSTDLSSSPGRYTNMYALFMAQEPLFASRMELRVGWHSQQLPVFVRMLDKDSRWGFDNGLKTLVTTLLQMSFAGYNIILPDMIGGNGYGLERPNRELFVRWMQANVFMPAMQFSFVPWMYDQEVVDHALLLTELHADFTPLLISLTKEAMTQGHPLYKPVWWLEPSNEVALSIEDAFVVGRDGQELLVAPVLDEGAVMRDVYLPEGKWQDQRGDVYQGPTLVKDYSADLWTLPRFQRIQTDS